MRKLGLLILAVMFIGWSGTVHSAEFTMKVALTDAPKPEGVKHYSHTPLIAFKDAVEKRSNNRIEVKLFFNGALGKSDKVVPMVAQGLVEGTMFATAALSTYYPDVEMLNIPYLFVNRQVAYKVLDGPFGQKLADDIAKNTGIRPGAWLENGGYRNFTSNKPIQSPEDMKGQKIRTMSNPVDMAIVRALGASPTPISFADLYTSLQTGVVDGQENAIPVIKAPHLYEVQKYMILDGHVYSALSLLISQKWLDSLPDDLREIVRTEANNMRDLNREISQQNEKEDRVFFESKGMVIYDPSPEVKNEFRKLTQGPVIEEISKRVSPERLKSLLETVNKVESTM